MVKWLLFFTAAFIWQTLYPGSSALPGNKKPVQIQFNNTFGGQPVILDEQTYINPFGEALTIHAVRYYISSVELLDDQNILHPLSDSTFLVDEADSASKTILLETGAATIKGIRFTVGVDSIKNTQGVQEGTLDPGRGMFWTWNSGYVMAKLEGSSPAARTPANRFSYHVGGYRTNENAARRITCLLDSSGKINGPFNRFCITAELTKWFQGIYPVRIAEQAVCHSPGTLAMQLADNYAGMFHIKKLSE